MPIPDDFAECFARLGWDARHEYGWSYDQIVRWRSACGPDRLDAARLAYRNKHRIVSDRARRKRYILGKTLRHVGIGDGAAPVNIDKPLIYHEE